MARIDARSRTFLVGSGGVTANRRVKLSSGAVVLAGANERWVGVAENDATEGQYVSVMLRTKEGTIEMVASAAITNSARVYGAASGKISSTSTSAIPIGHALNAAAGDGSIVEVLVDESALGS